MVAGRLAGFEQGDLAAQAQEIQSLESGADVFGRVRREDVVFDQLLEPAEGADRLRTLVEGEDLMQSTM